MRLQNLAVREQGAHVCGHLLRAGVGPHRVHPLVERRDAALQRLQAHREEQVGDLYEPMRLVQHVGAVPAHLLGAIDEGEAVLRLERDRRQVVFVEHLRRRAHVRPGRGPELPLAQKWKRQVGQRREVARRPHAAATGNRGNQVALGEEEQPVEGRSRDAGVAEAQRVDLEAQDEPTEIFRHKVAHPHGVAEDEVALKCLQLVARHLRLRKRPEAGVDAVVRLSVRQRVLDPRSGPVDGRGVVT